MIFLSLHLAKRNYKPILQVITFQSKCSYHYNHARVIKQPISIITKNYCQLAEEDRIMTIPNVISIARICATPLICYIITLEYYHLAAVLFALAGLSDMFDGFIARNVPHQKSKLGAIIDPLADKFLVNSVCLTLTYVHLIPIYATFLIFLRDIGIMSYIAYVKLNNTNKSIKFTPTFLSKFNTGMQLLMVSTSLLIPLFKISPYHQYIQALYITTSITTLLSGIQYYKMRKQFLIAK